MGGLVGAFLFVEMGHRGELLLGAPFPGVATNVPFGAREPAFVTGIDGDGILFWGFCGLIGGMVASIIAIVGDRRSPSPSLRSSAVAALVWIATIAAAINGAPYALPVLGAGNGVLFVRGLGTQGRAPLRSALAGGVGWLIGAICAWLLVWAYQES
jgi:hypothetical protein